jgi:hypothetical protein
MMIEIRLAYFASLKQAFEDDKGRLDVVEKEIAERIRDGGELEELFEEEEVMLGRILEFEGGQVERVREVYELRVRIKELLFVE